MKRGSNISPYPLRLTYTLAGLASAYPLTCLLTDRYAPQLPYYSLMLAFLPIAFILPAKDFPRRLSRLIFRFILAAAVGFAMFFFAPMPFRIAAALYAYAAATVFWYADTERLHYVIATCSGMLLFDFIIGFLLSRAEVFPGAENLFAYSIPISVFAALGAYILRNVDQSRYFGDHRLPVPRTIRRMAMFLTILCGMLITIVSFASTIPKMIAALLRGIASIIQTLFNLFAPRGMPDGSLPAETMNAISNFEALSETHGPDIPEWLLTAIAGILFTAFALFMMYKLFRLLVRIIRYLAQRRPVNTAESAVRYEEAIEKLEKIATPPARRTIRREKYRTLHTERERIRFIYREYVRKAERKGFTANLPGNTPNDVLQEIGHNASGIFPLPGELGNAYHNARYGDSPSLPDAETLRKNLLL